MDAMPDALTCRTVRPEVRTWHRDTTCVASAMLVSTYAEHAARVAAAGGPWACRRCALLPTWRQLAVSPADRWLLVATRTGLAEDAPSWQHAGLELDQAAIGELAADHRQPSVSGHGHLAVALPVNAALAVFAAPNLLTVALPGQPSDADTIPTLLALLDTAGPAAAAAAAYDLAALTAAA